MNRRLSLRLAVATVICGAVGGFWMTSAGASTGSPRIVAHPHNLMVNTQTHLTGTNFKPSTSLTVKECGQKNWIVPQNPCDSTNSIVVETNTRGQFKSVFTVQTCPGGTPGFAEKCYMGVPTPSGVDTITLLGAATVVVTGP
jgi:hypothetical protein